MVKHDPFGSSPSDPLASTQRHSLAWDGRSAPKKFRELPVESLTTPNPEERFSSEAQDPGPTPELAFERTWAVGLVDRAVHELWTEYTSSGRAKVFEAMAPIIWGAESTETLAGCAAALGMTVNSFTVALHLAVGPLRERTHGSTTPNP